MSGADSVILRGPSYYFFLILGDGSQALFDSIRRPHPGFEGRR
jgi:hypothetical protein